MVQVAPFPSSAPEMQLRKAHFGDFCWRGRKRPLFLFSIFHMQPAGRISREIHGRSVSVRSTDGLVHFEDVQFSSLRVAVLENDAGGRDTHTYIHTDTHTNASTCSNLLKLEKLKQMMRTVHFLS